VNVAVGPERYGGLNSEAPFPLLDDIERKSFRIEPGVIQKVDRDPSSQTPKYSYSVFLYSRQEVVNAEVVAPMLNYEFGSGIYAVPQEGSHCLLLILNESNTNEASAKRSFIIGFISPMSDTAGYRGKRRNMEPGSISLLSDAASGVNISSGGSVEVRASNLANRFYNSVEALISDRCGSYFASVWGGRLEWRKAEDGEGTVYDLRAWAKRGERGATDKPHVRILAGNVGVVDTDKKVFDFNLPYYIYQIDFYGTNESPEATLAVKSDGTLTYAVGDGSSMEFNADNGVAFKTKNTGGSEISMDKDGNVLAESESGTKLEMKSDGEFLLTAQGGTSLKIDASGVVTLDAGANKIDAKTTGRVNVESGTYASGGGVVLGPNATAHAIVVGTDNVLKGTAGSPAQSTDVFVST